jgi:hypothetical protein
MSLCGLGLSLLRLDACFSQVCLHGEDLAKKMKKFEVLV